MGPDAADRDGAPLAAGWAATIAETASIELLRQRGGQINRVLGPQAVRQLRDGLTRRLTATLAPTAEWQGLLTSDGPESDCRRLLLYHPELRRLTEQQVDYWQTFVKSFLVHTARFLRRYDGEIRIAEIACDQSDLHSGNKAVLGLQLSNGERWFYKPRAGTQEQRWFALLEWLRSAGFSRELKTVHVISRRDHCWMEAVPVVACTTSEQLADYYGKAGALLYLVYCLRGVDFHAGNIVACRSDPVLVDCETFGHPSTRIPAERVPTERGVLRTGLISAAPQNVSGFGRAEVGPHLPTLRGTPARPSEFVDELQQGFESMHGFLQDCARQTGFNRRADALLSAPVRIIYAPTAHYGAILRASLSPRLMACGEERAQFLTAACSTCCSSARRLRTEVVALRNGDIPLFRRRGGGRYKLLSASAMKAARRTIRQTFTL